LRRLSENLRKVLVKLSDIEAEAAETEVWHDLAVRCGYLDPAKSVELEQAYNARLSVVGQDAILSYDCPGTCAVYPSNRRQVQ
jgi:hypothetical protein